MSVVVFDKLRYGSFIHDYNYWRKNNNTFNTPATRIVDIQSLYKNNYKFICDDTVGQPNNAESNLAHLQASYIRHIIEQGVYINESLNLLQDYILKMEDMDAKKRKYEHYVGGGEYKSNMSVFTDEQYDNALNFISKNNEVPRILGIIHNIARMDQKPLKYCIVGTILKDDSDCSVTLGTLRYLQKLVKSNTYIQETQDNVVCADIIKD